jgi:predicted RNase H-like nuclease
MEDWIAGVDGCKGGWVVAYAPADDLAAVKIKRFENFAEILNRQPQFALVFIDIPIGLEKDRGRECDKQAREKLGWPRRNSVFPAPLFPALKAWRPEEYEEAKELTRKNHHLHKGLNKQSHALFKKIHEVNKQMTPELQDQIIETHPELIFAALNRGRTLESKKTSLGEKQRLRLLSRHFPGIKNKLENPPQGVGRDDIFDAFACLWAAHQYQHSPDACDRLPKPPRDAKGLKMEMVFPKCDKK